MSLIDIINDFGLLTDSQELALFKAGAETRKAELRKKTTYQLGLLGIKLDEEIFDTEKKVKAGKEKKLELDKLKIKKQEVIEVIAEKGALPPTTEQAQSAELIPEEPASEETTAQATDPTAQSFENALTEVAEAPQVGVDEVTSDSEETTETALGTSPDDPNVKCPGDLNTATVALITNNLLDKNGFYKGFSLKELKNCAQVEELLELLVKDGFLNKDLITGNLSFDVPALNGVNTSNLINKIEDVQNKDLSRLRFVDNLEKYLDDPIAFMTNYVWNYNLPLTNEVQFQYRFPGFILSEINKKTEEFVSIATLIVKSNKYNQSILDLSAEGTNSAIYNIMTDYFFCIEFSDLVREYLEKKFGGKSLAGLEFEQENIFTNKNLKFFWIWWNQVFVKNVELLQPSKNSERARLRFSSTENNYIALSSAFYFLETYFNIIDREIEDINVVRYYDNKLVPNKNNKRYELSKKIFEYVESLIGRNARFINSNNFLDLKQEPQMNLSTVVQVKGSPFFVEKENNLTPGEEKAVSSVNKVKRCKEVSTDKKETSLNLFYKEDNDDILDKEVPPLGLGCSSPLDKWEEAENIIFSATSILSSNKRTNIKLPYYNDLRIVGKKIVPDDLNIYKIIVDGAKFPNVPKVAANFRTFATRLFIELSGKKISDLLMDNSLLQDLTLYKNASNKLIAQYFDINSNKWGGAVALDRNKNFPKGGGGYVEAYAPYIGAIPFGYRLAKTDLNGNILQDFYINLIGKNAIIPDYFESALDVFDSQIKYAKGYTYRLFDVISFSQFQYFYDSIAYEDIDTTDTKPLLVQYEIELKKLANLKTQLTTTPVVFVLKRKNLQNEISFREAIIAQLKPFITTQSKQIGEGDITTIVELGFKNTRYINAIEEIEVSEVVNPLSYVDLPPTPLFMKVFPLRGINDKLIFSFEGYSLEDKIQTVKVPPELWTEGWSESRQYFIDAFKNFSQEQLTSLGIEQETVAEDDMFFAKQPIEKIKIYFSEGQKPKKLSDLQQFGDDIDIATQGFTKQIDLKPNTKYYFSAKAVSFTGLLSEYSQVYEVELVDDGGAVFVLIDVVDLEEKVERSKTLEFGNKFRVQPALLQQAPNTVKNDIGYLTPSVFSPTSETRTQFKVRLTSKKTGKKVDFNLIYKKDFNKNNDEKAGDISLQNAKKENVLISYNAGLAEAAFSNPETVLNSELENVIKVAGINLNPVGPELTKVNQGTSSTEVIPGTEPESSLVQACCFYDNKPALYSEINVAKSDSWKANPVALSPGDEIEFRLINANLEKLNAIISQEKSILDEIGSTFSGLIEIFGGMTQEEAVFEVLKSLPLSQKCYLCKRKREYKDISMLEAIEKRLETNSSISQALAILNCKQFGFFSPSGATGGAPAVDNNGYPLDVGAAAAKCSTVKQIKKVVASPVSGKKTIVIRKGFEESGEQKVLSSTPGKQKVSLGGGGLVTELSNESDGE